MPPKKQPTAIILNLYGWDLVNALKGYAKLEMAKEKIGVGGLISGEQIGRPLGYANNAGIWGLIWDPKINTDSSRRFIQGVSTSTTIRPRHAAIWVCRDDAEF